MGMCVSDVFDLSTQRIYQFYIHGIHIVLNRVIVKKYNYHVIIFLLNLIPNVSSLAVTPPPVFHPSFFVLHYSYKTKKMDEKRYVGLKKNKNRKKNKMGEKGEISSQMCQALPWLPQAFIYIVFNDVP